MTEERRLLHRCKKCHSIQEIDFQKDVWVEIINDD